MDANLVNTKPTYRIRGCAASAIIKPQGPLGVRCENEGGNIALKSSIYIVAVASRVCASADPFALGTGTVVLVP